MERRAQAAILVLVALATVPLLVGTTLPDGTPLILAMVGATVLVAWGLPRTGPNYRWGLAMLVALSAGIAIVSILTGRLNGLSDEPYSTPSYATLGLSMYTQPVSFSYVQYGVSHLETSYDVYLPLLTYVQVPGLDYRWVALGAWAGTLYLLRDHPFAAAGWGTPWIPLLAANGQNDFVPLLALTLALAVPRSRWTWCAEIVALALKQFANVVVVAYHIVRGEYARAALAGLVTVAILLPFLWISPGSVYCHVVVGDPTSGCAAHPAEFILFKRNYWLYPTWVGLVFHRQLAEIVCGLGRRIRATRA
jgi:hypothetical protein